MFLNSNKQTNISSHILNLSQDMNKIIKTNCSISSNSNNSGNNGNTISTTNSDQIYLEDFQLETIENLFKFRNENLFTDVYIYVEGVEFPCHKVILCAASCYFKAMFSCDLKESRLGKVYIENISPWTMKRLLDFIYTGKIEINYENVIDLFNAAVLFQLYKLVDKCINYVKDSVDLNNCIEINLFASMHQLTDLENKTFQFILENFMQLINISLNIYSQLEKDNNNHSTITNNANNNSTNTLINQLSSSLLNQSNNLNFDFEQLDFYSSFVRLSEKTFTDLLESDLLNVTREIYVYYAINKWVEFNYSLNSDNLPSKKPSSSSSSSLSSPITSSRSVNSIYENLFKYLRLNALTKDEIEFILNNDKYVKNSSNLTNLLKRTLEKFHSNSQSIFNNDHKISLSSSTLLLQASHTDINKTNNMSKDHTTDIRNFIDDTNTQQKLNNNIRPSTLPREYLCLLGVDQFQFYDFYKSKWDVLNSWPTNSFRLTNSTAYFPKSYQEQQQQQLVEDDITNESSSSIKLKSSSLFYANNLIEKKKLNGYSTCCINNILYVLGGYLIDGSSHQSENASSIEYASNLNNSLELVDTVYRFDPIKNEWSNCRPMLTKRAFHISLTLNTSKTKFKNKSNILNENFIFLFYGLCYSNDISYSMPNLVQCLSIEFYSVESDQWSVLNLNNSLAIHHIFNMYHQYNRNLLASNANYNQDQNESENQNENINLNESNNNTNNNNNNNNNNLKALINLQLAQSRTVVSLKNLIYILNDSCIHCYELDSKQKQLICLPYFRLPTNLNNFILAGAISVKTSNITSNIYNNDGNSGELQCKTLFSWYSDSEDSNFDPVSKSSSSLSSTSSSSYLNDSPTLPNNHVTDFSNYDNYTDSDDLDINKRVLFKQEKEAVIYILNPNHSILYEFYPAKNKLIKLPNLLLKHAPNETFILKIKSKLYVTGGIGREFSKENDQSAQLTSPSSSNTTIASSLLINDETSMPLAGSIIEVYDQETKTWSMFMNIIDNINSILHSTSSSSNRTFAPNIQGEFDTNTSVQLESQNESIHLNKNFFKLKMSLV